MNDAVEAELGRLPDEGVTSFKLFMAYKGMLGVDDLTLVRALEQARRGGAVVMVHAENGDAVYLLQRSCSRRGNTGPEYPCRRPPEQCRGRSDGARDRDGGVVARAIPTSSTDLPRSR